MSDTPVIRTALGGFPAMSCWTAATAASWSGWGRLPSFAANQAWWSPRCRRRNGTARKRHTMKTAAGIYARTARANGRCAATVSRFGAAERQQQALGPVPGAVAALAGHSPGGAPGARLLNLFGYTGAATLVAAQAGWRPTHVDASRPAVAWARENQQASGLSDRPIRWIVEDALRYVRREITRGSRYEGILLDPPAFGRGPDGRVWKVERQLPELLDLCRQLFSERPRLMILTTYNIEASSLMLRNLLADSLRVPADTIEAGELALPHAAPPGRLLPLSIYARWSAP